MTKLRVGIVFGGKSAEHEVSLQSARNIINALDKSLFEPVLIGIHKSGEWELNDIESYLEFRDDPACISLSKTGKNLAIVLGESSNQFFQIDRQGDLKNIDVVFPIVHGSSGEDGCMQGVFRMANLPFVGSDVLASAVCMDKDVSKRLLRDAGLSVVPFITVRRLDAMQLGFDEVKRKLGPVVFIKPANQGSSIGVTKAFDEATYLAAIGTALEFDEKIVIETAIEGREIECAVMGNEELIASACGEIVVSGDFYTYDTKYIDKSSTRILIPAKLEKEVCLGIQDLALKAFKVLGCAGMARIDFFVTLNKDIYINEVNTLPGFTDISMYPKLWEESGIGYVALVERLILLALERFKVKSQLKLTR
ncbi:D-alanine--D-alanine ligase [Pseudomonas sp. R3-52-08]|uniref:D-alanine--D-alanine ligase n=1 Tax=Pseudomonas sp. R3-52-08 TaxID=1173284 RepID=UPI000F568AE0|nr:D-alanine--D-alanine ligase [Pseudomonas sp. R3-52-08]AZF21187.1 D-alanine--D-alanine ligase [Pseudomonas sp. R3-52-08]